VYKVKIFPKDDMGATSSLIKRLKLVLYPAGEFVVRQGEIATDMYFIVNGEVHIYVEGGIKVASLTSGSALGEMALVQEKPSLRNASAICYVNSQIAELSQADFDLIRREYPQFDKRLKEEVELREAQNRQ